MRSLVLQDDDWDKWKFGDTNAVMTFEAKTDEKVPDYANSVLTFHLARAANKTLGDYVASAPGHVDESGKLAQLNTSDLTELKPDTYAIELWLTDKNTQKVSVFPSDGFVFFTVDENTMGVTDIANIPTKTIQAVYADLLQKIDAFKTGEPGQDGKTPKLKAGTVTKLDPDAQPTYTLTQDTTDPNTYIIDFGIPSGAKGDPGDKGKDAVQPIFNIASVTTLDPGKPATATIKASTDLTSFNISLGIPMGPKGNDGKNFEIAKTYKSIKDMNDSKGAGLTAPAYVMIASDVNDADNGKLYEFSDGKFTFVVDLSGPQGATGPSPVFSSATATKLAAGTDPTATVTKNDNGTYSFTVGVPQGAQGNPGPAPKRGTDYWTDADKQAILDDLKKHVDDDILNGKW